MKKKSSTLPDKLHYWSVKVWEEDVKYNWHLRLRADSGPWKLVERFPQTQKGFGSDPHWAVISLIDQEKMGYS